MSLKPTSLKKGVIFSFDDQICESLDYKQKVMARQASNVTVKFRNLETGKISNHTFIGGENLSLADCYKQTVSYLYADTENLYFMDQTDFNQYSLARDVLESKYLFLKEGQEVILLTFNNQPLTIELPKNVALKVTISPDVVRGDTTGSVLKEVETETGLKVKVPAFIKVGDLISVDTSSGNYRERYKEN